VKKNTCGFASKPGNSHCWINGHCAICKITFEEHFKFTSEFQVMEVVV
jgi:hypothetical protein